MDSSGRAKYRVRRGRKVKVAVRGVRHKEIDKHLLAQAVITMGRQLQREQKFFDWLMAQDKRVAAGTMMVFRHKVAMLDSLIFAIFDGSHLVCCLPPDDLEAALKLQGARLWAPRNGELIFERWVRLPDSADLSTWEHYGLAAMRYAISWAANDQAS